MSHFSTNSFFPVELKVKTEDGTPRESQELSYEGLQVSLGHMANELGGHL